MFQPQVAGAESKTGFAGRLIGEAAAQITLRVACSPGDKIRAASPIPSQVMQRREHLQMGLARPRLQAIDEADLPFFDTDWEGAPSSRGER
jgi:hypothetical protein